LVFAELGLGHVLILEDFRPAEFVEADGFHDSWQ
jgi:hypothetical protein